MELNPFENLHIHYLRVINFILNHKLCLISNWENFGQQAHDHLSALFKIIISNVK